MVADRWRRLVGFGLAAVFVLTGCTTEEPPSTDGPSPSDTEQPEVVTPRDRDEQAVLAAVRRLDLCAVLQSATSGEPRAEDPFSCEVDGAEAHLVDLGTDQRLTLPVRAISGVKSYVDERVPGTCRAHFPVSFELAVTIALNGGCGLAADRVLTAVAAALAEPVALVPEPRWDACGALAEALGDGTDPEELLWAGTGVGAACERWKPGLAHLDFGYGNPLIGATTPDTVGGVPVELQEDSTDRTACWVAWRIGPAELDLWAGVAAEDCGRATELAESVMTVLESPPPDVAPQQPLLYRANEPDTPYLGACAHLERAIAKYCRPFAETPVPDGTVEILRAASTDADIQCAVSRAAITKRFGTQLIPVAVDAGTATYCYFVEPERRLQIQFNLGVDPVNGVPEVFTVEDATIAGHAAYIENAPNQSDYHVWVGLTTDPADDGDLSLEVSEGPAARGAGPPEDTATKTERAVADILDRYFS